MLSPKSISRTGSNSYIVSCSMVRVLTFVYLMSKTVENKIFEEFLVGCVLCEDDHLGDYLSVECVIGVTLWLSALFMGNCLYSQVMGIAAFP